MLQGKLLAKGHTFGAPFFMWFRLEAERLVAALFSALPNAEPAPSDGPADVPAVAHYDDAQAAAALAAFHASLDTPPTRPGSSDSWMFAAMPPGVFKAAQIGANPRGPKSYVLNSVQVFNHTKDEFSCGYEERRGPQCWHIPIAANGRLLSPYNRFTVSPSKETFSSAGRRRGVRYAATIAVPFEDYPLERCATVFSYHRASGFVAVGSGGRLLKAEEIAVSDPRYSDPRYLDGYFPTVRVTGPSSVAAGERTDLEVTLVSSDGAILSGNRAEVHLESTAGYLNRRRLLADPSGRFSFRALDLDPGETVKIKAGFRNYVGLADHFVTVT